MSKKLAISGGEKIRNNPFPSHPMIGEEEKRAVLDVLNSGKLSTFIASPGAHFFGGIKIREFEDKFKAYHNIKHAVAFNSATAALHAAVVACGVQPGEEVITTPYSFTASATCALMHNAVPVFADVKADTFNLDPKDIRKKVSPLTRAINVVHLYGNPADMDEIMQIAREKSLKVIEDCAQAPAAKYKDKLVGTIGDCGIFSFTETKTITSGEGGMLITHDDKIAEVAKLVRNHGEAVVEGQQVRTYKSFILGYNYRMTELDAAVGIEQFKKLDKFNDERIKLGDYLSQGLKRFKGITPPIVYQGNKHVYWMYGIKFDEKAVGVPRDSFVKALQAEGIPCAPGYVKPLYYSPIYHENKPFIYQHYKGNAQYGPGSCPVAEELHFHGLINTIITRPPAGTTDMDDIINAFGKIIENKEELLVEAEESIQR